MGRAVAKVDCMTGDAEVQGLSPTQSIKLCPQARHFTGIIFMGDSERFSHFSAKISLNWLD